MKKIPPTHRCSTGALGTYLNRDFLDDARAKIKTAADLYALRFVAIQALPKKLGGGWKVEDFS